MGLVLDASIALAWFLPDETSASARELLVRLEQEDAWAPSIWQLEIANALVMAERRKRISESNRKEFLEHLAVLPVSLDQPHTAAGLPALSEICRTYALSIYDACYLQLAQSRRVALATFDRELRAAAARSGVATLP